MEVKLSTLEEKYNLKEDFAKLENQIKKQNPNSILLQFPDGLKPYATEIAKEVKKIVKKNCKKEVSIKIWLGSCFGACDIPNSKTDLLVQIGHAPWN
jgi:2-(3-amino-3-carboxypropyl)histidine synthase